MLVNIIVLGRYGSRIEKTRTKELITGKISADTWTPFTGSSQALVPLDTLFKV
jgi:hypothetical protein